MQRQPISAPRTDAHVTRRIETPLGSMLAVATARGIVRLEFDRDDEADPPRLETDGQSAIAVHLLNTLTTELTEYFAGNRTQFSVPVDPSGSDFAQKAWAFLRQIPFGQTRSYGAQARAIAGPNAARAVGRANGSNPIAIVIPCHRVIGADGSLTGFSSGIERKRWLLDHERKNRPSADPMLFPA